MKLFFKKKKKRKHFFNENQKKSFKNPFFQNKKSNYTIANFLHNWRARLIIIEIVVLFLGLGIFFLFSPIFKITNIDVEGLSPAQAEQIKNLISKQSEKKRFFLFPQKYLTSLDRDEIYSQISEKFSFESLEVKKDFPAGIFVKITEKSPRFVWQEGESYYFADEDGLVIRESSAVDVEKTEYPVISDEKNDKKIKNNYIKIGDTLLDYVLDLFVAFLEKDLKTEKFIIQENSKSVKIELSGGPDILFNTEEDMDKQIEKLDVLIAEKLKDEFSQKNYIDLRFGDKIYYK